MVEQKDDSLSLPVAFEGFSNGDKTCRIGISFDRSALSLAKTDKLLCDKRLTGTLYATAKGDANGQQTIPGAEGAISVTGSFDVKGFKCSLNHIKAGLTFSNADHDLTNSLCQMAKRNGRVVITTVADLEDDGEEEGSDNKQE